MSWPQRDQELEPSLPSDSDSGLAQDEVFSSASDRSSRMRDCAVSRSREPVEPEPEEEEEAASASLSFYDLPFATCQQSQEVVETESESEASGQTERMPATSSFLQINALFSEQQSVISCVLRCMRSFASQIAELPDPDWPTCPRFAVFAACN